MKRIKNRISPKSKYNAVLDVMSGKGTFEKIARKYNMSVSTLWNYNASADAAIRKVVGLKEDCISPQKSGEHGNMEGVADKKTRRDNNIYLDLDHDLVIRVTCSKHKTD